MKAKNNSDRKIYIAFSVGYSLSASSRSFSVNRQKAHSSQSKQWKKTSGRNREKKEEKHTELSEEKEDETADEEEELSLSK